MAVAGSDALQGGDDEIASHVGDGERARIDIVLRAHGSSALPGFEADVARAIVAAEREGEMVGPGEGAEAGKRRKVETKKIVAVALPVVTFLLGLAIGLVAAPGGERRDEGRDNTIAAACAPAQTNSAARSATNDATRSATNDAASSPRPSAAMRERVWALAARMTGSIDGCALTFVRGRATATVIDGDGVERTRAFKVENDFAESGDFAYARVSDAILGEAPTLWAVRIDRAGNVVRAFRYPPKSRSLAEFLK